MSISVRSGEHDIGRHAPLPRDLQAKRLQGAQQRRLLAPQGRFSGIGASRAGGPNLRGRARDDGVLAVEELAVAAQQAQPLIRDPDPPVAPDVDPQEPRRHHLADQRAPLVLAALGPDPEGRNPVMAEARDLVRPGPPQDVDQVRGPEALARPVRCREDFSRILGPVDALGRVEADVAVAARLDPLPEILQQRHPPAGRRLAVAEQGIEALVLPALAVRTRILVLDELAAHPDVLEAVEHVRLGRGAVAARAADLLIIGLHAAGQIGVEDVAHVRLVDPHAESDGGDDHHARLGHESVLVRLPRLLLHARVVGERAHPVPRQHGGGLLGLAARQAVDDAALALVPGDEVPKLPLPVALHLHRELDVGAVEAEHELPGPSSEQLVHDVVPRHFVGGRRQRRDGDAGEEIAQAAEVLVFRPEGRAPLRDAVGLVDGEEPDREAGERRQHALRHQPLGRHVEKPCPALRRLAPGRDVGASVVRGVDAIGRDARQPERGHLVLHQGDQGGHHHREPVHDQGGDLEAERLARSRRHHGERMAASQERLDHPFLARPESVEAEDLPQHPACRAQRTARRARRPRGRP